MSILINDKTRIIVQGITGKHGKFHTDRMLQYGDSILAGVTPGKGGESVNDIPVFNTVAQAKKNCDVNTSIIFVPPAYAADSILEAVDSGIELVVCITEGIPVLDMMQVKEYLKDKKTKLIGPNCPGIITPEECNLGIIPGNICLKGHVGVVSRSGTLTYEAIDQLSKLSIGQSTAVGIGGDPIRGFDFIDILNEFESDEETLAVVMIGEIGGSGEEQAADWIKLNMKKPVISFISGKTAPPGKRMGHAGAIIAGGKGTASEKIKYLKERQIAVANTLDEIGTCTVRTLKEAGVYQDCVSV